MPLPIELRPGPGIRAIRDAGRALRALYLVTIREGVTMYMTAPGKMSPIGKETFQAALAGAYAACGILLNRWLNAIPREMALRIQSAVESSPLPREIEMADFDLARQAVVRSTCSAFGTTAEAAGFDLGGPLSIGFSEISTAKRIGEDIGHDTTHKHPIADMFHDIERDIYGWLFPHEHNPYDTDEPDPKRQKPNPVVGTSGDFSGLVTTFRNPVTSRIIGYKGIPRKRKFSTLEKYSPFWKEQMRLTQTSVLAGPS